MTTVGGAVLYKSRPFTIFTIYLLLSNRCCSVAMALVKQSNRGDGQENQAAVTVPVSNINEPFMSSYVQLKATVQM